jgi:protein-disulfide isomerase
MMKKLTIIVFALSIFSILSKAQGSATAKGPVIKIPEMDVNIGVIPREKPGIVGQIVFLNIGDKPLEIKKVSGTCSCFGGYSGDEVVQPGASGTLQVSFEKNKIPTGSVTRIVEIETNDPANEKISVKFHFTIQRNETDEHFRILDNDMTALRNQVVFLQNDVTKLLKLLEEDSLRTSERQQQPDFNLYDVNTAFSPVLGPKDAPVTIVEFTDFQCRFCVREYPKLKQVMEMYPGKIKLVFKHFPLEFHTKAKPAHAAAQLVFEQRGNDAFWKMHDLIMQSPGNLEIQGLRGYATNLDLILAEFDDVMTKPDKINKLLAADMETAKKCNVTTTPTVLINGLKLQNREINDYQKRIDEILAKASK